MGLFKNINFDRLKAGLTKTRTNLINKITETVNRKAKIDADTIEELEEILLSSDIGIDTTEKIIESTRKNLLKEDDRSIEKVKHIIKNELLSIVNKSTSSLKDDIKSYKPYVILIIGVNGSGKTTSIGKLAYNFKSSGFEVIIGSADTFRAAANDQLEVWANRAGVLIIQGNSSDPSAVAYDTIKEAKKLNSDIVIIDTAGRLHTQKNLMNELSKIKNVIKNNLSYAPTRYTLLLMVRPARMQYIN